MQIMKDKSAKTDPRCSVLDHLSQTFCPAFLSRFFCSSLLYQCETFCPACLSRLLYVVDIDIVTYKDKECIANTTF
jgi:hypothetical protein